MGKIAHHSSLPSAKETAPDSRTTLQKVQRLHGYMISLQDRSDNVAMQMLGRNYTNSMTDHDDPVAKEPTSFIDRIDSMIAQMESMANTVDNNLAMIEHAINEDNSPAQQVRG